MFGLQPPRHISTLPDSAVAASFDTRQLLAKEPNFSKPTGAGRRRDKRTRPARSSRTSIAFPVRTKSLLRQRVHQIE
jgi:hypothetical protein